MTARAVWFGPEERPLFGWIHDPGDGAARGGVVLCPTLGVEAMCAHRAMRALADDLSSAGYLVVRFDYEATGDSAGEDTDQGLVQAWVASVGAAVGLVREAGARRVALIGLRIGGTLAAAAAAEDDGMDALVLWDPCVDGRSFIREQQALKAVAIGETPGGAGDGQMVGGIDDIPDGSVEILGSVLGPRMVSDLGRLTVRQDRPLARQVLVLTRPDRPKPRRLTEALSGDEVEWEDAVGQAELVDVLPDEAVLPRQTIDRIVAWTAAALGSDATPVVTVGRAEAHLSGHGDAVDVVERPVELGPLGLFGITTEPATGASGPLVVFLNAGLIPHVGPARLWVELARRFAASGLRTVRFDLSGLGDSPARPSQRLHFSYPPEAIDDIGAALACLSPDQPSDAILLGLCAGAYHAIEGGIALGVRGVCAINPILHFDPPSVWADGDHASDRQVLQPYSPWIKRLRRFDWLVRFGELQAPPSMWWVLDKVGLQSHPARGLEALADRGVSTLLICGDVEARPFQRRAKWAMRQLVRSRAIRFEILSDSDHTLFGAVARARATALIADYVLSSIPRGPRVPTGAGGPP